MSLHFNESPTTSLGVEWEFGLIDLDTGALASRASDVFSVLEADGTEHPCVKHEFLESTIEIITGVCATVGDAREDLTRSILEVDALLAPMNVGLAGFGIHPFSHWEDLVRSPGERYARFEERMGWVVKRMTSHGLHVHVGVRSESKVISIVNGLREYLPILLALSAASPYRHGIDTALASTRTKVFEAMPNSGVPPQLADWAEFSALMDTMLNAGSIQSVREIWWDVRPHPGFGTVEIRICDAPVTLTDVMALAALCQCLVQYLDDGIDAGEPIHVQKEWVQRENKWSAVRWGLDAELILDDSGSTASVRELTPQLVEDLVPVSERLGCSSELRSVLDLLTSGSGADRMRRAVDDGADLPTMTRQLHTQLMEDVADAR